MHVQQKGTLFMGDDPFFFQKSWVEKIGSFWKMPGTHGAYVDRAQNVKVVKLKSEIRSFIHLTWSEPLFRYRNGISVPSLKFDSGDQDGSHGDGFK
jgi:hypothetical protein